MEKILLGTRIPSPLAEELKKTCQEKGLKISYLVTEALREKLEELKEEEEDIATVEARENEPTFSEEEWNKFLRHKGKATYKR